MTNDWLDGGFDQDFLDNLVRRLKRPASLKQLSEDMGASQGYCLDAIEKLKGDGFNIVLYGKRYELAKELESRSSSKLVHDGFLKVGVIADTHLGSSHERLDVCEALYDWYEAEGITHVYHCGNWIDGIFRFNKNELQPGCHTWQGQIEYFIENYPRREGITTYYVAGDDHEGWITQREGIDVGRYLENEARDAGRGDLVYLGYKEHFVTLEHSASGRHARLLIDHPGGGSAYAHSYAPQKRIAAAQPGEKPAIWCFGHWHKAGYFNDRGVHAVLVPCTKDLDTFGRKKGLQYMVGGVILEIEQDPEGGVSGFTPKFKMFFDRGYYNHQYETLTGPPRKEEEA